MRSIGRRLQLLPHLHWGMFLATLALLGLGVAFVYSACYVDSDAPVRVLYRRQLFWAAAGLVVYAVCALGDYRRLRHWAWTAYAAALALLVLVLLAGVEVYGARRWLPVMGVKVQPSEFAKLALVLILAKRLARPGVAYADSLRVGGVLALSAAPMLLILKQPDLGTAAVVVPVTLLMMLAAGVPLRVLLVLVGIGLLGVGIVLAAALLPERLGVDPETAARWRSLTGLSDYQFKRILVFFQADADPLGAGWNRLQSEIAVGSGGLWGKGYLRGTQNILGFLPRSVAPTDFIFSVIAEELGFGGSALVLGLHAHGRRGARQTGTFAVRGGDRTAVLSRVREYRDDGGVDADHRPAAAVIELRGFIHAGSDGRARPGAKCAHPVETRRPVLSGIKTRREGNDLGVSAG